MSSFTTKQMSDIQKFIKDAIAQSTTDIIASINITIDQKFDQLRNTIDGANRRIEDLEGRIKVMSTENLALTREMESKLDHMEQYSRRSSIRIFGIPEQDNENVDALIITLGQEHLKLQMIQSSNLDVAHRVGKKSNKPRAILVKFVSRKTKEDFLRQRKELKGKKISIVEDLTQKRAKVLQKAAEVFGKNKVWTANGYININLDGNKHKVTEIAQLEKLMESLDGAANSSLFRLST